MPAEITERPQPNDYMSYYGNYIGLVPAGDLIAIAEHQISDVRRAFGALSDAQSTFRYAPDKWNVREVVGHVTDTERVFSYRATSFARADAAPLPGFDQAAWNPHGAFGERTMSDLLEEWESVRRATIALMRGMPTTGLQRRGVASDNPVSVLALLVISIGHVSHHLNLLHRDYAEANLAPS